MCRQYNLQYNIPNNFAICYDIIKMNIKSFIQILDIYFMFIQICNYLTQLMKQKRNIRPFALIKPTKVDGKQIDPHRLETRISSTRSLFNVIELTFIVDGFLSEKTNYQYLSGRAKISDKGAGQSDFRSADRDKARGFVHNILRQTSSKFDENFTSSFLPCLCVAAVIRLQKRQLDLNRSYFVLYAVM